MFILQNISKDKETFHPVLVQICRLKTHLNPLKLESHHNTIVQYDAAKKHGVLFNCYHDGAFKVPNTVKIYPKNQIVVTRF